MNGADDNRLTGAASLAVSLALAAVLLAVAVAAEPEAPPDAEASAVDAPASDTALPAFEAAVVYLPPPPQVARTLEVAATPAAEPAAADTSEALAQPPPLPDPPKPQQAPVPETPVPETPVPETPVPETQAPETPTPPPVAAAPTPAVAAPPPLPQRPRVRDEGRAVDITPESIREGRTLLRLLERGDGPDIEIAWPAAPRERDLLYRLLRDCFGMRTVVVSADGGIFGAGGFDGDRYSGFARQPTGGMSAAERRRVAEIRARDGVESGRVMRLFPRQVDAIVLGALHRIAGDGFANGIRIRARYRLAGDGVRIADINVDGATTAEFILLPYTANRSCRRGHAR